MEFENQFAVKAPIGEVYDALLDIERVAPAMPGAKVLEKTSDDAYKVGHTADWIPMQAGQRIMFDYGGGGGWGNPLDRDPQAVLDDVIDEYVSVDGARRDYGVVLTGSLEELTLAIDESATDELRAEMRKA